MSKNWILWDRYAKVTFTLKNEETVIFERFPVQNGIDSSPDFEIESEFDTTENTNICKITLINLTNDMVKKLVRGTEVLVEIGYLNDSEENKDIGVIYKGIIEETQGKFEGTDKKFTVTCNTYNDEYKDTKINLKAGRRTKASTIIHLIISKLDKLKVGKIELTKDIVYENGKTLNNNVKSIFKTIAKDCESIFFIKDGLVYFQKSNDVNLGVIEFDPNLFMDITSNQDGYTLKSVIDHRLKEGYKLKIDLKEEFEGIEIKGEYLIIKGKHIMKFNQDAYTEIEIKTKLEEKENEKVIEIVTNASGKNKNASKKKEKKEKKKKGKAKNSKKNVSKKTGKKDNDWERIKNTYGVKK